MAKRPPAKMPTVEEAVALLDSLRRDIATPPPARKPGLAAFRAELAKRPPSGPRPQARRRDCAVERLQITDAELVAILAVAETVHGKFLNLALNAYAKRPECRPELRALFLKSTVNKSLRRALRKLQREKGGRAHGPL